MLLPYSILRSFMIFAYVGEWGGMVAAGMSMILSPWLFSDVLLWWTNFTPWLLQNFHTGGLFWGFSPWASSGQVFRPRVKACQSYYLVVMSPLITIPTIPNLIIIVTRVIVLSLAFVCLRPIFTCKVRKHRMFVNEGHSSFCGHSNDHVTH